MPGRNQKAARGKAAGGFEINHHEEVSVLGRPGSDLLFQVLRLSTIGAGKFYGRVRDGIGYRLPANTTRPAKDREAEDCGHGFHTSWSCIINALIKNVSIKIWINVWDVCRPCASSNAH
jgi:hypothetical protein